MFGRRICSRRFWFTGRRCLPPRASPIPLPATTRPIHYLSSQLLSLQKPTFNTPHFGKTCFLSSHALADAPIDGVVDVPLAQTGEGIAECELLKWFVQEGDEIEEFQPLCEVQSDKATIEITSRYKGKVVQILHVPGDIVKVGETLLKMGVEDFQVSTHPCDDQESAKSQVSEMNKDNTGGGLATPAVRNLAKQHAIILNDIQGTGKEGRVLKEDVLKFAVQRGIIRDPSAFLSSNSGEQIVGGSQASCPYSSPQVAQHFDDKIVLLRGFQRAMVKTMAMAAKVPHFYYVEEIKCDALVNLKASFNGNNSDPTVKHTFLPLLIKSLSMALSKYPMMNSCFNEDSLEVTLKGSHNIGIAMATPNGLVVPSIKNVQSLSILEITKELSRLQQSALNNKLSPEDVSGGTITLSNIGAIGGKVGSPLLNLPEAAIIALGRIQKTPQFGDEGNVYPVSIMTINIGADHRVLDGATVARFCNEWKLYIEKPDLLMLHMR